MKLDLMDVLPSPLIASLQEIHAKYANNFSGKVATYIPELAKANPKLFGIALVTADGYSYEVGDALGLGDAGGLDQDGVGALGACDRAIEGGEEVPTDRAAHAAIGERQRVALARSDQRGVDGDVAEVVDHHDDAPALGPAEHVVHQGRLAGAEIAADDGHRNRRRAHVDAAGRTGSVGVRITGRIVGDRRAVVITARGSRRPRPARDR